MTGFALLSVPPATVRSEIDRILAEEGFVHGENAWKRWWSARLDELLDALSRMFGIHPQLVGELLVLLLYGALGVALVWITWRIVRARTARAASTAVPDTTDPETLRRLRVRDLRRAAGLARERGERLLALRLYFIALVVGLGERGDLAYRDAWTIRELLERGRPREIVRERLAPLVGPLDAQSFGHALVEDTDVARMSALVDELLGAEAA